MISHLLVFKPALFKQNMCTVMSNIGTIYLLYNSQTYDLFVVFELNCLKFLWKIKPFKTSDWTEHSHQLTPAMFLFPSQVTKVATSRPLPENPYHSRPRPEPNPVIEGKLEPSKHGSKLFFWNWWGSSRKSVTFQSHALCPKTTSLLVTHQWYF